MLAAIERRSDGWRTNLARGGTARAVQLMAGGLSLVEVERIVPEKQAEKVRELEALLSY